MTSGDSSIVDTAVDTEHPWLGLASFTEETRQFFFGREEEIAELARRLQRTLLTVLFGQSGLGKTSILRAGIVPRLRQEGFCPIYVRVDYSPEAPPPSEQVKRAIDAAAAHCGAWTRPESARSGESLWERLHHRDDVLRDAQGKTLTPLLVFDQFEEVFTLAQTDAGGRRRAAQFLEELADLAENRAPSALEAQIESDDHLAAQFDFGRADYRVLIALREDYLAHLEGVKASMPSITQNRMRLARMHGEQALAAVMKPGGSLVSREVAEAIVRFVGGGSELRSVEVEPALLSLICRELNNARIAKRSKEISADLLAGSHDTILSEFYERALADQPAAVRKVIEDDLLTDSGYRENLAEERIAKAFAAAGAAPEALATLVNRRLLRIEERLDLRRVELTHDVLCGVVKASRETRQEREARDAAERELHTQTQRAAATRRELHRVRRIAIVCAVLAIGAVLSAVFGYVNMRRARVAQADAQQARQLADRARSEAEKLVVYLLEDFHDELQPVGRLSMLQGLTDRTLAYYRGLPSELRTNDTERNRALALVRNGAILRSQAKSDEAAASIQEAEATLEALRAKGDKSDATTLGHSLALQTRAEIETIRSNFVGAVELLQKALAALETLPPATRAQKPVRRLEGLIWQNLGLARLRERIDGDAAASARARDIYRELGALDGSDTAAASGFAAASSWLAEALGRQGKEDEGREVATECVKVADTVIAARPNHLSAMRAKGICAGYLARYEFNSFRVAAALAQSRVGQQTYESLVTLDPTVANNLNNLNVRRYEGALQQFHLGRVAQSLSTVEAIVDSAKGARINAFQAGNFIYWSRALAVGRANFDGRDAAQRELARAKQFFATSIEQGASENGKAWMRGLLAIAASDVALANQDYREAIAIATKYLREDAAAAVRDKLLPDDDAWFLRTHVLATLGAAYRADGDFVRAESAAREALALHATHRRQNARDDVEANAARMDLAQALAGQGRSGEVDPIMQPVLQFLRGILARGTDDQILRADLARALYIASLADPNGRAALRSQALAILEALPPEMKRYKRFETLRTEILRVKS